MSVARECPYGLAVADHIEDQLNIGWSQKQGTYEARLNTILEELNLKEQYLYSYAGKDKTTLPRWRRNAWIKRLLKQILWTFDVNYKQGLWKTAFLQGPGGGQYRTIPHYIEWLKTPEGRRALRATYTNRDGEQVEGALWTKLKVEIGDKHKLNILRHRTSPEVRQKRKAAAARRARKKERRQKKG